MNKTYALFKKEIQNYFLSPLAYIIIGFFLLVSGYFFSTYILSSGLASMRIPLSNMSLIFLFIMPILTMHLLAEERKGGTEELLLTTPTRTTSMVVGKYLAALFLLFLMLLITGIYPVILFVYGNPETGPIISGYIGIFLLGAAALAVGIFSSSLTENQIVAAIVGFSILLLFWVADWAADAIDFVDKGLLKWFSILYHFDNFSKGIIDLEHIFYYLTFIFIFIFLAIQNIERRRWS